MTLFALCIIILVLVLINKVGKQQKQIITQARYMKGLETELRLIKAERFLNEPQDIDDICKNIENRLEGE